MLPETNGAGDSAAFFSRLFEVRGNPMEKTGQAMLRKVVRVLLSLATLDRVQSDERYGIAANTCTFMVIQ